jgi:tripartite-type tricarboxylate transporter receptor subunit TctC
VSVTALPQVQAKKMKAIAVTDDKRLASLPDVPTVSETPGFKDYDVVSWTGLFAPAHTPQPIVDRLNHELNEVLRADDVKARMAEQGAIGGSGTPADFARFVVREQERYARIVKAANIKE